MSSLILTGENQQFYSFNYYFNRIWAPINGSLRLFLFINCRTNKTFSIFAPFLIQTSNYDTVGEG